MRHASRRERARRGARRRSWRGLRLGLGLVMAGAVGGLAGCAATAPETAASAGLGGPATPGDGEQAARQVKQAVAVLTRYRDALVQGRADDAWALLAPGTVDQETFRAYFADHRHGMILEAREALRVARSTPPTEVAFVRSGTRTYELIRTPDGWRIRGVTPGPASNPASASAAPATVTGPGPTGLAKPTKPAGPAGPTEPDRTDRPPETGDAPR